MADVTHSPARGFAERSVFWMILVAGVAVTLLIAVLIAFTSGGESAATRAENAAGHEEIDQKPTGAGTNPDGAADHATEGMATEPVATEPAAPGATTEAPADTATTDATNETAQDVVVDPDGGQPNEPDGGADAVTPTPSGPEGSDNNPLTAN